MRKLAVIIFLIVSLSYTFAQDTIFDTKAILTSYGFEDGYFNIGSSIIDQIPRSIKRNFSEIEENPRLIDTAEEFITGAYFSELPTSIEITPLQLCAMWYKKLAENQADVLSGVRSNVTDYQSNYLDIIDWIIAETEIANRNEAKTFYDNVIEQEIMRVGLEHLGSHYSEAELRDSVLESLVDFYRNPTLVNLNGVVDVCVFFEELPMEDKRYIDILNIFNDLTHIPKVIDQKNTFFRHVFQVI